MARRFLSPALADLRQDIAGSVPLDLVFAWADSAGDQEAHDRLLAPFLVRGTVVSSDASGLSRLSKERPLLDVLRLVQEPKESIHAYGRAVGGEPVGVWAADNTQMFYPATVNPADVVAAMAAALAENAGQEVRIGMAAHVGTYLRLGGGLFGADAEFVEHVAEDHTKGGELVMSGAVRDAAEERFPGSTVPAPDIRVIGDALFRFRAAAVPAARKDATAPYPAPFDRAFADFIRRTDATESEQDAFLARYRHVGPVVFLKVRHKESRFLLDRLADWADASAAARQAAATQAADCVKCNGDIGIFLCPSPTHAERFALGLRDAIVAAGFTCNVGVADGETFVFPLDHGGRDIAGVPVNLASKLSEEMGEFPNAVHLLNGRGGTAFSTTISGVELRGARC